MEMRRDAMVCQRNSVSIAIFLCVIVVGFICSHGKPFDVDEKVENLWQTCHFTTTKINKQLHSSDVSPEEIELALRNCLIAHQTKHLSSPYSNDIIALRHQLVARRKTRALAHESMPAIHLAPALSPTAISPFLSPAPASVPAPAPVSVPEIASVPAPASVPEIASVPAPSPASDILLPITTFAPPPKRAHHSQVVKNPQRELKDKFLLIKAVAFSVLGTSLVAFVLFCCYRWKKKREFHAYSQSRPLLGLTLSDFSGSSHTSTCSSPIDVSRLGALKSDPGHHQNKIHHNASHLNLTCSLKATDFTGNTVPLETVETKTTELTPFHAPPPPPPPLPQKTPPGPPPPPPCKPGPPRTLAGSRPGPPPPPPLGDNKPGAPRPPGPLIPSKGQSSALKTELSSSSNAEGQKPKLKPFFWDKVSANPEQAVVWNQIKSGSFQFSEEMIENLFGYQANEKSKATGVKGAGQSNQQSPCVRLLESKKSQNLAISLKALNVKIEHVLAAVNEGNELPSELVETLLKMWPTTQEENRLLLYSEDLAMLGPAEQFLIELIKIDHVYDRLDCLYFMLSLQEELNTCKQAFSTLEVACKELKDCRLFKKILEAVIKIGNFINKDTNRGGAVAIKLDNLLKLRDLKAKDGKTTLLHVVMQEIIRLEGKRLASQNPNLIEESDNDYYYEKLGLKVISGIGNELENVKKSAGLDMDIVTNTVEHLGKKLDVIKTVLETKIKKIKGECGFRDVLERFVNRAEGEVEFLAREKKLVWDLVENTAKSFYPSTKKDEGLRLFVVVRDFLCMWDRACKDVKEFRSLKDGSGSGLSSGVSVPDPRQHLFPAIKNKRVDGSSSDEDG